ncbi:DUF3667 domain-containing protein [Mucilaginibacter sp. UR6-1]|uniref:DUF3667 domain-containing protein n=1 Tax=Mucilaginibacter sp. UR6-1 TaxID=1435643 RepID=UPI001E5C17DA|nr:DUF3667 domain-containing protein [Mucilaginibacter sp. UR6-1]MCC8408802.1 DUF3667 domain-containing protein [Mucilaginibacter sp. UR6-1]
MVNCGNCNTEVIYKYCPECGQPAKLKRIDGHYIQHELLHVLHFEKGILYTIKELLLRPGKNVRSFIAENRSRLVKPIIFIIISSLLYTIISHFFHTEEGYINIKGDKDSVTYSINSWVQNHYGYSNIIMGIFIVFWLKLFFRKSTYNFYEILILLCFVIGIGMLMFTVFAIIEGVTHHKLMAVSSGIYIIYATWAIGQFFNSGNTFVRYTKAFIAYLLGMVSFTVITLGIGIAADLYYLYN